MSEQVHQSLAAVVVVVVVVVEAITCLAQSRATSAFENDYSPKAGADWAQP